MDGTFQNAQACIEAFGQDILFQDISTWIVFVLGIAVVIFALIHLFTRGRSDASYYLFFLIFLALGLGTSSFALTGKLPSLSSVSASQAEIKDQVVNTWRVTCFKLNYPVAAAEPLPPDETREETITNQASEGFDDPALQNTFVWVFYSDARRPEGYKLRDALATANIENFTGEDSFSAVRLPRTPGTIRVLYSEERYKEQARILAEAIRPMVAGEIYLDGPYPNMKNQPLQVLMF